jgi:hypothetical protein
MQFDPAIQYVYFVQRGDDGPVKIGLAKDVVKRLDHLISACPDSLTLRAVLPGNADLERMLHSRFAADRIRGEWFRASPDIVAFINSTPKALLRELKHRRRHGAQRTPLADARRIWADPEIGYKQAREMLVGWTQARIAGQLGPRNVPRRGHAPKLAAEYGAKGGRPRIDRGITDEEAEKHWFDMRHPTNAVALKHMGKWTLSAAWRKWGESGRKTGPRRAGFVPKPKPKT